MRLLFMCNVLMCVIYQQVRVWVGHLFWLFIVLVHTSRDSIKEI